MEFYEVWADDPNGQTLILSHTNPEYAITVAQDQYPGEPPIDRRVMHVDETGVRSLHWPTP